MMEPIRLAPVFKDYIWGGTQLRNRFGKDPEGKGILAESWELSTHPDGESVVARGPSAGKPFFECIKECPQRIVGSKAESVDIPILIKFIDAREDLSVQVHPSNEYARRVEGDNGKTEMWVVMSHAPGAALYYGMRETLTKDQVRERIADRTIMDALNRVEVEDGDVFFIPAGTIHAIGAGMMICEIQQRSNVTYRLYDYGRVGKDGRPRELHIDKALDVADLNAMVPYRREEVTLCKNESYTLKLLDACQYFQTYEYELTSGVGFATTNKTFVCLVVLSGTQSLAFDHGVMSLKAGDTVFLPAQEADYQLKGVGKVLAVSL